ncbi:50S ribosomal protein L2 [Sulfolobales archaeon HS-7]|nr:50S ribosomal protein L2 [Sulfolobales archaeon HS-7]
MGKSLLQQRAGRGNINFRNPGWTRKGKVRYPSISNVTSRGQVVKIVHNPGSQAPIAKIKLDDGNEFYNVAVEGLRVGQEILIGEKAEVKAGNILPLQSIPDGSMVCNIEVAKGDGGKIARSAGTYAIILGRGGGKVSLKLSSDKVRDFPEECRATVGKVSGGGVKEKPLLKAGNNYHKYRVKARKWPRVNGVKMNVVDHPHGGGHHRSVSRSSTVSRNAPPGRKVGHIASRRTGRRKE